MNIIQAINEWADAMDMVAKAARAIAKIASVIAEQTQGLAAPQALAIEAKEEAPKAKASTKKKDTDSEPEVTQGMIRTVLAEKSQSGLTPKVKELLNSFGAEKLSAVKSEDYPALYEAAKALG